MLAMASRSVQAADMAVAAGASVPPEQISQEVERENAERQQRLIDAKALMQEARTLVAEGRFEEADKQLGQSEAILAGLSGDLALLERDKLARMKRQTTILWAKSIEAEARRAYVEKDYDKAIMIARNATRLVGLDPVQRADLQSFIEECEGKIDATQFTDSLAVEVIDPEKEAREYDVDVSVAQARKLLATEQFTRARDTLEKVLVRDPYNVDAMEDLKKIYKELQRRGDLRRHNDFLERIAEVEWKWSEAVLPLPAVKPESAGAAVATRTQSNMYQKLNRLIIDHIELEEASISAVVRHLVDLSKRLDPDKTGVSILLNMKEDSQINVPTITMSFDDIPLIEVIRYICQGCDLRYRIEEHAVIIGTDAIDPMDTRFFTVRTTLIASIPGAEEAANAERTTFGDEGFFDATATLATPTGGGGTSRNVTSEALQAFFVERGIPFPEGSTIAYDRRAGKLVVRNNLENLRRLDSLLRELDIETPLVLIEAKFIEITQTDLEDLGFQWLFSKDTWPTSGSTWTIPQNDSTTRPLGTNASGVDSPVNAFVNSRLVNNAAIMPAFGANDTRHLNLYVHALDQSGRVEVLSAPKVLATSGQTAFIRMVRMEYYPESWTEPELVVGEGSVQFTPSYPELGEATNIGINLEVTPTVSPNNYTISLQLYPSVIERTGWTDYTYVIDLGVLTGQVSALQIMPELSRREITATVRVYDGEMLVLGGMLRDQISAVDDRIPLLGDLPLIGRLARTKNEQSDKINLMIFITARLVNPDGLPVRVWDETKGLPDFRRL
jgi:general secretion pathway protein D